MAIWQNTADNSLHDDMDGLALAMPIWPVGMVELTDAQVAAARAPTLAQARAIQVAILNAGYAVAIAAPVSFTNAAGTAATYPQTDAAKQNLTSCITTGAAAWSLNLWLDVNGNPVTPFTYADLQALAAAMEAAEAPDFQELLTLVSQVSAATTVAAVQAIVWPAVVTGL